MWKWKEAARLGQETNDPFPISIFHAVHEIVTFNRSFTPSFPEVKNRYHLRPVAAFTLSFSNYVVQSRLSGNTLKPASILFSQPLTIPVIYFSRYVNFPHSVCILLFSPLLILMIISWGKSSRWNIYWYLPVLNRQTDRKNFVHPLFFPFRK